MDVDKQMAVLSLFGYGDENDALSYHYRPSRVKNFSSRFAYYDQQPLHPATAKGIIPSSTIYPANIGILKKGAIFSVFKKKQADEAAIVYNFLLFCDTFEEFAKAAKYFKSILNESLYLYAVSVALAHRKDGHDVHIPIQWQLNPHTYFTNYVIKDAVARSQLADVVPAAKVLTPTYATGTNRDPEFKVSWWREDVGLNYHHVHWHQVYPWRGIKNSDGIHVNKDREGELFYYMHAQMLARYDAERLATGLLQVLPYADWDAPLLEGYDSHLTDVYGTHQYGPRPSGMVLADNYQDHTDPVTVDTQKYNHHRLLVAINTGQFIKKDRSFEDVNIDNLGAAVESSISSPNPNLYGSIHNLGHDLLSVITDPDGRFKQAIGVMGELATAVRDPVFFRWHKFIDNLFDMHKSTLDPYSAKDFGFKKVTLELLKVQQSNCTGQQENVLTTRMEDVKVDIYEDMFQYKPPQRSLEVIVHRVNHDEFHYTVSVKNNKKRSAKAVFRIFIAPSFDEHGDRLKLNDQRRLFIEMDKFVKDLPPNSTQKITRPSTLSSVVKPTDLYIEDILNAVENQKKDKGKTVDSQCGCRVDRYCECGLPPNILLPRGTESGMKFDLFVMVTDWSSDNCTDDLDQGTSYCGVKDQKYPDGRAMGFPFDRRIDDEFLRNGPTDGPYIDTFVKHFENMMAVPVTIVYKLTQ